MLSRIKNKWKDSRARLPLLLNLARSELNLTSVGEGPEI